MNETKIVVLTVSESKRLIAKGVAHLDTVKKALERGMISVAKGSTNAYVVEELLGKRIDKTAYVLGRVLPEKSEESYNFPAPIKDVVLKDGKLVDISVVESVQYMGENDIFIKGCNILNYEKKIAGVLMSGMAGGTIGATIEAINRNKIKLVLPVGLEKSSHSDIYSVHKELEEGVTWRSSLLRLVPLTETIVTEIEALKILTGVDAIQISAGGIGGAEGSVRLLLKGDAEQVRKAEELVENIQGEPPFLFMETIKSGRQNITINGGRFHLRELNEDDASQEYCNWLNDPIVNKFLETKKATVEELKQYIKEKRENPDCLFLGIFLKDTNKHIGNIKLEPVDFENKKATLGILIGNKDYWGKGIGTEATKLLADYAFNSLDLKEVNLGVISENKAAIEVYKKAGFKTDRINKKSTRYGNKYYDAVIMSLKKENH